MAVESVFPTEKTITEDGWVIDGVFAQRNGVVYITFDGMYIMFVGCNDYTHVVGVVQISKENQISGGGDVSGFQPGICEEMLHEVIHICIAGNIAADRQTYLFQAPGNVAGTPRGVLVPS